MTTRGKAVKGGAIPKVPRLSQSPGPMCKFVTHGTNGDSQPVEKPLTGRGGQAEKDKKKDKKKGATNTLADLETLSETFSETRTDQDGEIELEQGNKEETQDMTLLPTKMEMEGMFAALERSLKSQMERMERNMGHILERVEEEVEKKVDYNVTSVKKLEDEIKALKINQREQAYKLEEQENRDRRKNIRIRGVPETTEAEDLSETIRKICNPILEREITSPLKIERAHRIRRARERAQEYPRDIIVRFESWEEKNQLWRKLRGKSPLEFDQHNIQIYQDLSQETLRRRRSFRPLLRVMQEQGIQYNWGFPACLIGRKNGVTARLRFIEEIPEFCKKIEIPIPTS